MMLVTVLLVQPVYSSAEKGSDTLNGLTFNGLFGYTSASGGVAHFNDEGYVSRLSLGVGTPTSIENLTVMGGVVYGYYDVNAVADKNPSRNVEEGSSHSLGVGLMLRYTIWHTPSASYHLEGGAGFQQMLSNPPFPADGSDENFTVFIGPGTLIPMAPDKRLRISLQYFHISNAGLVSDNSGYDGLQLVVGFEWN